ncbi:MAG: OmpH family outer membrane protein [Bacteroidota bacterium]
MNDELNAMGDSQPIVEEQPKKCNNRKHCIMFGVNIATIIGVIVLFVLYFMGGGKHKQDNTPAKTLDKISYAYVNTDTLMAHYDFVLDVQVDLAKYEKILQAQYTTAASTFKKDYDDYIKRASAGLLTLDQQKKKEEELGNRQQQIAEMEQNLGMQMQEEKVNRNMEVFDSIVSHIKRYNQSKDYTFIFQQSYGGALLYANPALDITQEILKGLNEEYAELQKNKKPETEETKTKEKK